MWWRVGQIIFALLLLSGMVGLVFDIAALAGAGPVGP